MTHEKFNQILKILEDSKATYLLSVEIDDQPMVSIQGKPSILHRFLCLIGYMIVFKSETPHAEYQ